MKKKKKKKGGDIPKPDLEDGDEGGQYLTKNMKSFMNFCYQPRKHLLSCIVVFSQWSYFELFFIKCDASNPFCLMFALGFHLYLPHCLLLYKKGKSGE